MINFKALNFKRIFLMVSSNPPHPQSLSREGRGKWDRLFRNLYSAALAFKHLNFGFWYLDLFSRQRYQPFDGSRRDAEVAQPCFGVLVDSVIVAAAGHGQMVPLG